MDWRYPQLFLYEFVHAIDHEANLQARKCLSRQERDDLAQQYKPSPDSYSFGWVRDYFYTANDPAFLALWASIREKDDLADGGKACRRSQLCRRFPFDLKEPVELFMITGAMYFDYDRFSAVLNGGVRVWNDHERVGRAGLFEDYPELTEYFVELLQGIQGGSTDDWHFELYQAERRQPPPWETIGSGIGRWLEERNPWKEDNRSCRVD